MIRKQILLLTIGILLIAMPISAFTPDRCLFTDPITCDEWFTINQSDRNTIVMSLKHSNDDISLSRITVTYPQDSKKVKCSETFVRLEGVQEWSRIEGLHNWPAEKLLEVKTGCDGFSDSAKYLNRARFDFVLEYQSQGIENQATGQIFAVIERSGDNAAAYDRYEEISKYLRVFVFFVLPILVIIYSFIDPRLKPYRVQISVVCFAVLVVTFLSYYSGIYSNWLDAR